ncbi:MAG: hypothetical protein ACOY30_08495 [Bacillota bacterium]
MKIFLLLLAFAGIAYYEVPGLIHRKQWRELAAFTGLLSLGFVLSLLQIIGVKMPSPTKGIILLIKQITRNPGA